MNGRLTEAFIVAAIFLPVRYYATTQTERPSSMRIVKPKTETLYIPFAGGPLSGQSFETTADKIPHNIKVTTTAKHKIEVGFVVNVDEVETEDMGELDTDAVVNYAFHEPRGVFMPVGDKPAPVRPQVAPPQADHLQPRPPFVPPTQRSPPASPSVHTHASTYGDDVFAADPQALAEEQLKLDEMDAKRQELNDMTNALGLGEKSFRDAIDSQ